MNDLILLKSVEGKSVRFEMICLGKVHRHQNRSGTSQSRCGNNSQRCKYRPLSYRFGEWHVSSFRAVL